MKIAGINNGVLAGLVALILSLVFYFVSKDFYLGWAGNLIIVAYIFFMYKAGKEARDLNGGFISFGNVLFPMMITFALASFLVAVFNYILLNFIDSSLLDLQVEKAIETIDKMRRFMGDEAADAAIEQIEENGISYGPGQALLGWLGGLVIPGLLIALIMAAIMKKKDPSLESYV